MKKQSPEITGTLLVSDVAKASAFIEFCDFDICIFSYVQLRHQFSGKYVHSSTTQTSLREKNYLKVRS